MNDIVLAGADVGVLRDIPGYEGLYSVTRDGRVWAHAREWRSANGNRRTHDGMWLRADTSGPYLRVTLQRDQKKSRQSVHRLVALAWIPNPEGLPQVNHKDGDKRHNTTANLEWCTRQQNARHAYQAGLHRQDTPERRAIRQQTARRVNASRRKLSLAQANDVREKRKQGRSLNSLAAEYGIARSGIKEIVDGTHYAQ